MVLNVTEKEFLRMKVAIMDQDQEEALRLIREFHEQLEQQKRKGLKPHLDQH